MLKRVVDAMQVVALLAAAVFVILLFANEPDDSAEATTGKELFTADCARCHGPEGEGGIGPRLAGTVAVEYPDVEDQAAVVRDGRGAMPSFRGRLSPQQIDDVVAYTRTGLPSS